MMANPTSERLLTVETILETGRRGRGEFRSRQGPGQVEGELEVLLWDLNRMEQPIATLDRIKPDSLRRVFALIAAFSPDGKTVAIAMNRSSAVTALPTTVTVALRSAWDGQPTGQIDAQVEFLSSLALGASNMMATASGNTIQLWDREAGTILSSLSSSRGTPRLMRFNPQGNLLAAIIGNHAELWDTVSHKLLAVLPAADWITDVSFTPDGRTLAVGSGGRSTATTVWRVSDSAARVQLGGFEAQARPSSMAFNTEGCLSIGLNNGDVWFYRDGGNHCTSAAPITSGDSATRNHDREAERNRRTHVAYDAAGRLIAHDAQGLRIWNDGSLLSQSPALLRIPQKPAGPWTQNLLTRSTDGRTLALVRSTDVLIWDSSHPDRLRPVIAPPRTEEDERTPNAAPSPRASLTTGGPQGPGTRRESRGQRGGNSNRGTAPPRDPMAVQLAPGGDRLYMLAEMNKLVTWALEPEAGGGRIRARKVELVDPLPEWLFSLALRPDGTLLAVGDRTGTVTLVDTARMNVVGRIDPPCEEAVGAIFTLAFSPDGKQLAVGSPQGQVLLWSMVDPAHPHVDLRLPGQRGVVRNLAFDPAGRRLACRCDGTEPIIEIWNLELIDRELSRLGFTR